MMQIIDANGNLKTIPTGLGTGDSPQFTGLTLSGLTEGSILFAGASGVISQDNAALFWDATNKWLGLGTTTPSSVLTLTAVSGAIPPVIGASNRTLLHIVGGSAPVALMDSFGDNAGFFFRRANGSRATPTQVLQYEPIGAFGWRGYGSTGYGSATRASVIASAAENWTDSAQGAYFAFATTPTGGTSTATVATIDGAGNLIISGALDSPTAGTRVLVFADGTVPSGMASNTAGLYADDIGGTVMMHVIDEAGNGGRIAPLVSKSDTGDPTGFEGLFAINTFDNTFKVYADGAWRTLASGW